MKNRFLFFCFLWNKLQGFLAEDGIGATRVPTGNLYSAEISTSINLDAAIFGKIWKLYQHFKILTARKIFSKRLFSYHGAYTYSTHGSGLECQQCERRKESIFVFFITPQRGEMSHMICESLVNPKKSSRWKRCPNFDWKNYIFDEHFYFSGALFAIPV